MERKPGWLNKKEPTFASLSHIEVNQLRTEKAFLLSGITKSSLWALVIVCAFFLFVYLAHGRFELLAFLILLTISVLVLVLSPLLSYFGISRDLRKNKKIEGLATIKRLHFVDSNQYQPAYYYFMVRMEKTRRLKVPGFFRSRRLNDLKVGQKVYIVATYPGNRLLEIHGSRKLNTRS